VKEGTGKMSSGESVTTMAKGQAKVRTKRKSTLRDYTEAVVIAVVLTLFIRTFIIQAFKIPTGSMEDTLLVGDFLFVNKFLFGASVPFVDVHLPQVRDPHRGDIIVFKYPNDPSRDFIKRVIGTPGDTLQIKNKVVYINGERIDEPYAKFTNSHIRPPSYRNTQIYPPGAGNRDNYGPYVVPADHYFMMGDNRDNSDDSRFWGPLSRDLIKGKALFIYWSWNGDKLRPRVNRLGRLIH